MSPLSAALWFGIAAVLSIAPNAGVAGYLGDKAPGIQTVLDQVTIFLFCISRFIVRLDRFIIWDIRYAHCAVHSELMYMNSVFYVFVSL